MADWVASDEPPPDRRKNFRTPQSVPDTFSNSAGPFLNPGAPDQPGTPPPTGREPIPPAAGPAVKFESEPDKGKGALPSEAATLYARVRKAEGTSNGDGFVFYGGDPFTPGKEHPGEAAKRVLSDGTVTHAAGGGQWQKTTWDGLKPDFQKRFGREPDFSNPGDHEKMTWINAAKIYPGGEDKMRADIAAGNLDTGALAPQWQGFGNDRGRFGVAQSGKWRVSPDAIAHEQGRSNTDVVWMSPDDYLGMLAEAPADKNKRQSLQKSLDAGDPIEEIPSLDAKVEKGRIKIFDQDGRNRAEVAKQEGVTLMPVAVHGIPKDGAPGWIEGMRGTVRPFNFDPVPRARMAAQQVAQAAGSSVQNQAAADRAASQRRPGSFLDMVERGATEGGRLLGKAAGQTAMSFLAPVLGVTEPVIGAGQLAARAGEAVGIPGAETAARFMDEGATGVNRVVESLPLDQRIAATVGDVLGTMAIPAGEIAAAPRLARPFLAAGAGAAAGAAQPVSSPPLSDLVTDTAPNYWSTVGERAAVGGALGGGLQVAGEGVNAALRLLGRNPEGAENAARAALSTTFADRAAATGTTPSDVASRIAAARAEGQPITLADFPEMQGTAGAVSRVPGEAGSRMRSFFTERREASLRRLDNILSRYLPTGSVKRTMEALADERARKAAPLYEEAFAGGSIAPLEKQLSSEWNSAALVAKGAEQAATRVENELNAALARQSTAANVYASSGSNRAVQEAQQKIAQQRRIATEARDAEQAAKVRLRQAQADGTANAPGAIWSPTIQRLIDNPRVQAGIRNGIKIERDLADAEGRPMRLNEYAIVGTDDAGEPIVGAVPNMKLLAAAKKGLDSMVASMRHTEPPWRLTEAGRAIDKLRRSLLDELYRLNPKYKEANEIWGGGSEAIRALTDGQRALDRRLSVEDVRDRLATMSESDRDFYRLGVADDARKDLLNTRIAGDKSKAIINTEAAKEKLRAIIGSPEDAERFIQAIENERTMFETEQRVLGGSQTAERLAEDNSLMGLVHVGHALGAAARGQVPTATLALLRALREARGSRGTMRNPAVANQAARMLTSPGLPLRPQSPMLPPVPGSPNAFLSLGQSAPALGAGAGQMIGAPQQ